MVTINLYARYVENIFKIMIFSYVSVVKYITNLVSNNKIAHFVVIIYKSWDKVFKIKN